MNDMQDVGDPKDVNEKSRHRSLIRALTKDKATIQNEQDASEPTINNTSKRKRQSLHRTLTQLRGVKRAKKKFLVNKYVSRLIPRGP